MLWYWIKCCVQVLVRFGSLTSCQVIADLQVKDRFKFKDYLHVGIFPKYDATLSRSRVFQGYEFLVVLLSNIITIIDSKSSAVSNK